MKLFLSVLLVAILTIAFMGCNDQPGNGQPAKSVNDTEPSKQVLNPAPAFNPDSAYAFIGKQVSFGPRVPNTDAHEACARWLSDKLRSYSDKVINQKVNLRAFNGKVLRAQNIIASFNPESSNRIMLCAHWDTRPFADQDTERSDQPIDGANDGASGVGVLLEIARILSENPVQIGIDIILFDAEDYGQPDGTKPYKPDSYCLGSQHWSKNPHRQNYRADFGILLDMVGAANSKFTREGTSMYFAGSVMTKVWDVATKLGYAEYFDYMQTPQVTDDHLYINQITGIPTIDIIHRTTTTGSGFGRYWHTHNDNMDIIDKKVLQAVGQTVVQVIYNYNEQGIIL